MTLMNPRFKNGLGPVFERFQDGIERFVCMGRLCCIITTLMLVAQVPTNAEGLEARFCESGTLAGA